jgi:hypothetical protein
MRNLINKLLNHLNIRSIVSRELRLAVTKDILTVSVTVIINLKPKMTMNSVY